MHFSKIASLFAAMASAVVADNIITLKSLDDVDRTVYFTPNAGLRWIPAVQVPAGQSVDVTIDQGWIGNLYSVHKGAANVPGMLAEFAFNSWASLTYYDVSAIVNAADVDNVSEIYPFEEPGTPSSGCGLFPCANAYYAPNDVQTKASTQTHYVVTLGKNNGAAKRDIIEEDDEPVFKRDFVLGRYSKH